MTRRHRQAAAGATIELPRFTEDPEQVAILKEIVDRALKLYGSHGIKLDKMSTMMDLSACNAHLPLDLPRLLSFPDFDFMHDVTGIYRHLDRTTGELGGCFLPRCARS